MTSLTRFICQVITLATAEELPARWQIQFPHPIAAIYLIFNHRTDKPPPPPTIVARRPCQVNSLSTGNTTPHSKLKAGFVTVTAYKRLYLGTTDSFTEPIKPLNGARFILRKESLIFETLDTDCHTKLCGSLPRRSIRPITTSKSTQGISPKSLSIFVIFFASVLYG
jgi:hypothetical protein